MFGMPIVAHPFIGKIERSRQPQQEDRERVGTPRPARVYREDELALKLRHMHLLNESMKESKGSVVVPAAYAEGFTEGALEGMPKRVVRVKLSGERPGDLR